MIRRKVDRLDVNIDKTGAAQVLRELADKIDLLDVRITEIRTAHYDLIKEGGVKIEWRW